MRVAGIALSLALLAGCRDVVDAGAPALMVVADDPSRLDPSTGPVAGEVRFDLRTVRDLQVRYRVPELPSGVSWVTLRLVAPSGAVYHRRHVPVSADESPRQVPSPDGVARPIDVVRAFPVAGGWGVDQAILVAGTNLLRRPMPGRWELSACIDGRPDLEARATLDLGMGR